MNNSMLLYVRFKFVGLGSIIYSYDVYSIASFIFTAWYYGAFVFGLANLLYHLGMFSQQQYRTKSKHQVQESRTL